MCPASPSLAEGNASIPQLSSVHRTVHQGRSPGPLVATPRLLEGWLTAACDCAEHAEVALKLSALELQVWNCLASFASWAPDVPAAFTAYGDTIGSAFQKRHDLQAPICNMLRRVCTQTSTVLQARGDADGSKFGNASADQGSNDNRSVHGCAGRDDVPEDFTLKMAQANRECIRGVAVQWMPELLNRFVSSAPEERGCVGEALEAVAVTIGEAPLAAYFKESLKKVVEALKCLQVLACKLENVTMACELCCPQPRARLTH
jgi:hypothetical protein